MNQIAKIVLSAVLLVSLVLWAAVWWVAREPLSADGASASATPNVAGIAGPSTESQHSSNSASVATASTGTTSQNASSETPRSTVAVPQAPPATSTIPLASMPAAEAPPDRRKPPVAPIPDLPAPVKPDSQGVVDLSADPSTKKFGDALREGYARRLAEQARGAQGVAAPGK
jgi:hypothetical protein